MSKKLSFEPFGNRIIVERKEAKNETDAGLLLPESAKAKPYEGKVLATGPGQLLADGKRTEMPVNVGDTVLFARHAANPSNEVDVDGKKVLVMSVDEVLGRRN